MEVEILRLNISTKKSSPISEARQTYFALKTAKMQKNLSKSINKKHSRLFQPTLQIKALEKQVRFLLVISLCY